MDGLRSQAFGIGVFVEANKERSAFPNRRRTEVARRTEQVCQERLFVGLIARHGEHGDLAAFGHDDRGGFRRQIEGLSSAKFDRRVDGFLNGDSMFRKVPLRFDARVSAPAAVVPVYSIGHGSRSFG